MKSGRMLRKASWAVAVGIGALAASIGAPMAQAQPTGVAVGTPETLEQGYADAIAGNPELASERMQLEAAREAPKVARAGALPQVSVSATARKVDRDDPSFRRTGTISEDEWDGGASVSQLIYGSGRVRSSINQANAEVRGNEARLNGITQAVLLRVATAHADVLNARARQDAQQKLLENMVAQNEYVTRTRRAGFLTQTDVSQAEARVAAAQAQLARAQAGVANAEQAYLQIVGRFPGALAPIPNVTGLPASIDEAVTMGLQQNPRIRIAQENERAADHAINVARSDGRPRVSLEATSGIENGFDFNREERIIEDQVALRFAVPLFQGGAVSAQTRQRISLRESARAQLLAANRRVEQEVRSAWANLGAARESERAALNQLRAAEFAAQGVRREQQNGLRSVIDVLNQEQDLLSARINVAQSRRDIAVTERELLSAIGLLTCAQCAPVAPQEEPKSRSIMDTVRDLIEFD
jgi:TolC family type I secretion outer membrane protein